jgi:hypothetical protein
VCTYTSSHKVVPAISNTTGGEKGGAKTGDTTNLRSCASDVAFTRVLVVDDVDVSFASSVIHKQDNRVYTDITT